MSETANQNDIREFYAQRGARLWRNNVGALLDKTGRPIRYGLANDTKAMNEQIKSGDLIGWIPRLVTPEMVGEVIAQTLSIEAKPDGWKMPGVGPLKDRTGKLTAYGHVCAQLRWARMLRDDGGIAGIMIDPRRGFEPL